MFTIKLHIVTFPVWWYSTGLSLVWEWVKKHYTLSLHKSGILLFARHWKEPLYGDYSKTGIVLSFFLRCILLTGKSVMFFIRVLSLVLWLIFYVTILPVVVSLIFYQIFGLYA